LQALKNFGSWRRLSFSANNEKENNKCEDLAYKFYHAVNIKPTSFYQKALSINVGSISKTLNPKFMGGHRGETGIFLL